MPKCILTFIVNGKIFNLKIPQYFMQRVVAARQNGISIEKLHLFALRLLNPSPLTFHCLKNRMSKDSLLEYCSLSVEWCKILTHKYNNVLLLIFTVYTA